jgi:hypothetical protein
MEAPEVHKPHSRHHGGLPRWLEMMIAMTALITSISSIAIAVHHGHIMQKLVVANSIPYLQGGFSDVTPEDEDVLSLDLLNRGVGPAHEESLRVKVGDRYVQSLNEFLSASLGSAPALEAKEALHPTWSRVRTRFIPGGQQQMVFRMRKTPQNAALWQRLVHESSRWDVQFCYCSVFDECWQVRSKWQEPERIRRCRRDEAREFLP